MDLITGPTSSVNIQYKEAGGKKGKKGGGGKQYNQA
jgi:hypothetical protein